MEGGREREKQQCVVASCTAPTRDLASNPDTCPDWESNQWPFGLKSCAQSTELCQPGGKSFRRCSLNLLPLRKRQSAWQASLEFWGSAYSILGNSVLTHLWRGSGSCQFWMSPTSKEGSTASLGCSVTCPTAWPHSLVTTAVLGVSMVESSKPYEENRRIRVMEQGDAFCSRKLLNGKYTYMHMGKRSLERWNDFTQPRFWWSRVNLSSLLTPNPMLPITHLMEILGVVEWVHPSSQPSSNVKGETQVLGERTYLGERQLSMHACVCVERWR